MARTRIGGWWRRLKVVAACGALIGAAPTVSTAAGTIAAKRVVGGLKQPVAFTFGPGNKIWYVEKSTGEIRVFNLTTRTDRLFYVVSKVNASGERGMLGIALPPKYPMAPYVYVYVTRTSGGTLKNQILRITSSGGHGISSKAIFSSPASSSPYHNGGRILFGPDGMLYAIVGDGHDSANSQEVIGNSRGKILRMTPSGGIPADNPISETRVFAYGIRNSFGFTFDPQKGGLWETENGPECNDELNLIQAGKNYGWGPHETCSGTAPANTNQDGPSPQLPKLWYTPPIAPTGIAFCTGCGLDTQSEGALFFGAFNTGDIRRVVLNAARDDVASQSVVLTHSGGVLSVEVGRDGAIYFSDFSAIYRLVLA